MTAHLKPVTAQSYVMKFKKVHLVTLVAFVVYLLSLSRAKNLTGNWKHVKPGMQDTEVRWNKKNEVFVRIFEDDAWIY